MGFPSFFSCLFQAYTLITSDMNKFCFCYCFFPFSILLVLSGQGISICYIYNLLFIGHVNMIIVDQIYLFCSFVIVLHDSSFVCLLV